MNKFILAFLCISNYAYCQIIPTSSVLNFSYDTSGNQIKRSFSPLTTVPSKNNREIQNGFLENIQLFPVPVQNELTIKWENEVDGQIFSIGVYDHNQLMHFYKENLLKNKQITINMTNYSPGLYIIQFSLTDGRVFSKTIIKK